MVDGFSFAMAFTEHYYWPFYKSFTGDYGISSNLDNGKEYCKVGRLIKIDYYSK